SAATDDLSVSAGQGFDKVTCADLLSFGMIPEFVGRFPVITSTYQLTPQELVSVLYEPRSSIMRQFSYLFAMHGVELVCTPAASMAIAVTARNRGTGARGLRSIVEQLLSLAMFAIPSESRRDEHEGTADQENAGSYHSLVIDEAAALGKRGVVLLRGDLSVEEYLRMQNELDSSASVYSSGGVVADDRVREVTHRLVGLLD
ncbi:CLPX3, partial [Symbiodinium microadriaticum]